MKLEFDKMDERFYEAGVENGVIYLLNSDGSYGGSEETVAPWNGLKSFSKNPEGAEETKEYADNIKFISLYSVEELKATIECVMYPDLFSLCDGSKALQKGVFVGQQPRKPFGLSLFTKLGNAIEGESYSEKCHIIYGAKAQPSQRQYNSINESPEVVTFSYELSTNPVKVPGMRPSSEIVIQKDLVSAANWQKLIDAIHGTEDTAPYLPLPEELNAMFASDGGIQAPEEGA